MNWKIKTIETLTDKEITCPCCRKTENFQTIAQRNKIIRSHANCIAGDAISFQVSYYVYPTCSSQCVFCGCEVETDSYKKQQYCEPCLQKARKVFSLNDMIEDEEDEEELPVCEHCGSILAHPCDCQIYGGEE